MRSQFIKLDLQFFHISGCIVIFQNTIGNGIFRCLFPAQRVFSKHVAKNQFCIPGIFHQLRAVYQIGTCVI